MSKSIQEFFQLLGIKNEQLIDIRKPTKFRKIIIPEQSFLRNQYYTDEYRLITDTAYNNIDKSNLFPYEKIYFSRVGFIEKNSPNKECGEREIQDTFKKNGYIILDPEKLTVQEQIFYVKNCKEFVVIPGGASANAVFASDHTKRIYIRKAFTTIPDMFQIDQMTNADRVTFIDCYYEPYKIFPLGYGYGPHFIGKTSEFRSFLKKNNMKQLNVCVYSFALFKTWIWLTKIRIGNLMTAIKIIGKNYLDKIVQLFR